jgi:hypothetical protein
VSGSLARAAREVPAMPLARYALRRVAWLGPVLVGISLITFGLLHLLPGGPWDPQGAGRRFSPTVIANFKARYGLDRPLHEQYLLYVGNALRGDPAGARPGGRPAAGGAVAAPGRGARGTRPAPAGTHHRRRSDGHPGP